jgi:hypothetical protein
MLGLFRDPWASLGLSWAPQGHLEAFWEHLGSNSYFVTPRQGLHTSIDAYFVIS